jgi:hypothetical protein
MDEREYEVEEVMAYRCLNGRVFYLVKWAGYPQSKCTWEPAHHMTHAMEAVALFHELAGTAMPPRSAFIQRAKPTPVGVGDALSGCH